MDEKNRETRIRGVFLDPAKVAEECKRLGIDEAQLAARAGKSLVTVQKIYKRLNIDEESAKAFADVLGRSVEYLKLKDAPSKNDPKLGQSESTFVEQVKAIGTAAAKLYAELLNATQLTADFRTNALVTVHHLALQIPLLDPPSDDDIQGRPGSFIVTFPISGRDAQSLMSAFVAGRLKQFRIVSVRIFQETNTALSDEESEMMWYDINNTLRYRLRKFSQEQLYSLVTRPHDPDDPVRDMLRSLLALIPIWEIAKRRKTSPSIVAMELDRILWLAIQKYGPIRVAEYEADTHIPELTDTVKIHRRVGGQEDDQPSLPAPGDEPADIPPVRTPARPDEA